MLLVPAVSLMAFGQSQSNRPAPIRPKLYVAEFNPSSPTKSSLGEFARRLFQLRFRAVPDVQVAEDSEIPPCGNGASGSAQSSAPTLTQTPDRQPLLSYVPVFYKVQGIVDEHDATPSETEFNVLISYELAKTENCRTTLLFRRTKMFGLPDALQNLEDAAEELNSQLSDDVAAKVAVRVDTIEAVGDPKGTYRARDLLTRFTRQKVADADTFRLWDETSKSKAQYTLGGRVLFMDSGSSGVRAKVQFIVNGSLLQVPFPVRTVKATTEELIPFYLDASSAAVKGLSDLFYAQRAGLNQTSIQGSEALIQRATQLLCLKPATDYGGCSPDPQAALLALNEAQRKVAPGHRAEVFTLIGQARFQAEEYPAAGEAYDSALAVETGNAESRLPLLMKSADAWYEAKEYLKAADHYRECVKTGALDPSVPTPVRLQPEARVKLVRSLLLADKPEAALDSLLDGLQAARSSPNPGDRSKSLYNVLASELQPVLDGFTAKELESAAGRLESDLAYDPSLAASALYKVGRAYAKEEKYKEAVDVYRKVLALTPDDAEAHSDLGYALDSTGRIDEAITEYIRAITLKPDNALAHNNLGVALSRNRQYEEAIVEYRKAADLKPEYAQAFNNLAIALSNKGQYEDAEKAYQQAIRARPHYTLAYFNLWWLYRSLSKQESAQEVLRSLQKIAPDDPYTELILAQSREDAQDLKGAEQIYSKLHEQNPGEPFYLVRLEEIQIRTGMNSQDLMLIRRAIARLEQELNRNPSFEIYFALAWVYQTVPQVRNAEKSAQLYKKALDYRPDDLRILDNLTALALEIGDPQTVIDAANQVLKLNPRDPDALENLGYGRFLSGDLHGAIEIYEKTLQVEPNEPVLRILLGETSLWLDNPTRAHEEFASARKALGGPITSSTVWVWLMESRYDTAEKQRAVYYSTVQQKRALVELLDGLTYLREMRVASALERYRTATGMLKPMLREDEELIRKGINDLHRLEKQSLTQPTAEFGLGYLYDWLGETTRAVYYWQLYLKSGTDVVGLQEARRRLASNPK